MVKLSITIPCYNYARYLPACLDSVLSQEYSDYELILIDDGSNDESWQIMQEYASRFAHIHIFKQRSNQGIFQSAEWGIREAKGEYLFFLGADDMLCPNVLTQAMQLLNENPLLGLVCGDIGYLQESTQQITEKKLLSFCQKPRLFSKAEMIPLFQSSNFWVPGATCIVKRELLEKYGFLDPALENISDWFCFHKISLFEGLGYVPSTLVLMREHPHTYTSQVKSDKTRKRRTYRALLKKLAKDKESYSQFKHAGLLGFVFKELRWQLLFNPRYFSFWRYTR